MAKATACKFRGCAREARALGLCEPHYHQLRRGSSLKSLRDPGEVLPRMQTQLIATRVRLDDLAELGKQARKQGVTLYRYIATQLHLLARGEAA